MASAVEKIDNGIMTGTVKQDGDAMAATIATLVKNVMDGADLMANTESYKFAVDGEGETIPSKIQVPLRHVHQVSNAGTNRSPRSVKAGRGAALRGSPLPIRGAFASAPSHGEAEAAAPRRGERRNIHGSSSSAGNEGDQQGSSPASRPWITSTSPSGRAQSTP